MTVRADPRFNKLYSLAVESGNDDCIALALKMFEHAKLLPEATDVHGWAEKMAGFVAFDDEKGTLTA